MGMRKSGESRQSFTLRRAGGFFRIFFKNKMAATGFIVLIVSSVIAVTSPLFFPTNPQQHVAGAEFAQPEWITLFPEGRSLSKNLVVVNDPSFSSPAALQEWSYGVSDQSKANTVSFSRSNAAPTPGSGSLQVLSTSNSTVSTTVSKTFYYPYLGPPAELKDPIAFLVRAEGVSLSQPVSIRFFIDAGKKSYSLWSTNITQNGVWLDPPYPIESLFDAFVTGIGLGSNVTSLSVPEVIFPTQGNYTYGFTATFNGPGKIQVTSLGLLLLGSAYGVLGTDHQGSDLFSQDILGSRVSLLVGLLAAFIGIGLGLIVGLVAGYKTGLMDEVLMRFTDMMLVIPTLPLLIVLIAVLGPSTLNIIIIIGFLGWMGFARVIRSQVLSLRERPFIEAARAAGSGTGHILTKHVFPNIVSLTYVNLALSVPGAILAEAALSFLGLGDPANISWGQILNRAFTAAAVNKWWIIIPPGLAIAVVSTSFVFMGYALDEIFNPKLRRRR